VVFIQQFVDLSTLSYTKGPDGAPLAAPKPRVNVLRE
jgi:hypothetical protein